MNTGGVLKVKVVEEMGKTEHGGQCLNLCVAFRSEAGLVVPADRVAGARLVVG